MMGLLACNTFSVNSNLLSIVACVKPQPVTPILSRNTFPNGFIFGTSSAAYQYEGAAKKYGRKPSIWDTFTHEHPEKILDGSNGDVAVDQYHRYPGDVDIMKDMNLDAYRLSISWSRILPNGKYRTEEDVNQAGVDHYLNLIKDLQDKGIEPFVTLFHWDFPQALEDEYGGFLSRSVIPDFESYVKLCFEKFGTKVKNWITLNEPMIFTSHGYGTGDMAPGRSTHCFNPSAGNSGIEPYLVAHHLILAHAKAVQIYKKDYQESQQGQIGISLNSRWFLPYSKKHADTKAADRALDFELGWFLKPLVTGDYPESMRSLVGERLPKFTEDERKLINGSFDFIGLNYYSGTYSGNKWIPHIGFPSLATDSRVNITNIDHAGTAIGPVSASGRVSVYPQGIRDLLNYVKEESNNAPLYITENGIDELNDPILTLEEALIDTFRIDYYYRHLFYVYLASRDDDVNIKGYFAWSLMDNFEWSSGFAVRFGLNFVDYNNHLKRYPKLSAEWFKKFLEENVN